MRRWWSHVKFADGIGRWARDCSLATLLVTLHTLLSHFSYLFSDHSCIVEWEQKGHPPPKTIYHVLVLVFVCVSTHISSSMLLPTHECTTNLVSFLLLFQLLYFLGLHLYGGLLFQSHGPWWCFTFYGLVTANEPTHKVAWSCAHRIVPRVAVWRPSLVCGLAGAWILMFVSLILGRSLNITLAPVDFKKLLIEITLRQNLIIEP